ALVASPFDEELEALLANEKPLVVSTAAKNKEVVITLFVEQNLWQQEEFWQEVAKESKADVQRCITNSLEALACEGLSLKEATEVGEGLWQGQGEEEEEGAKEKTPDTTAGAAMEAATPVAKKAPAGGIKGLALPTKKRSPTKPASKCRGRPMPRYERQAPMQQDFFNKELARLLAPKQVEVVVDTGVESGMILKKTKSKVTVNLVTRQAFKKKWGV
ncbi:hypothetical protein C0993_008967, partial [Termitomyces sp. T159_Od127]